MLRNFLVFFLIVGLLLIGGFYYFNHATINSKVSESNIPVEFEIKEGQKTKEIGLLLKEKKLIKNEYYFFFYIWKNDLSHKIKAGNFELTPNLTIPEITAILIEGENKPEIQKITVPEGFTNKKIFERLEKINPEISSGFETIANCKCFNEIENCDCGETLTKYNFVENIPVGVDLEGYLFPDTYFIDKSDTVETLMAKFIDNFNKKVDSELMTEIEKQGKSLHEIITMASIIEKEAKTPEDRRIVSGIFWKRMNDNYPLQSCATLAYILGVDKPQYSVSDTETDSLYNTYKNIGLPPGPIANPGLDAIEAAIYPAENDYYFFLTTPKTGRMVYSSTLDEHNRNKAIHGL